MKKLPSLFSLFLLLSCGSGPASNAESADLIISGATVIRPSLDADPKIEDIAIRDGQIIGVGEDLGRRYKAKSVYDAKGRFVIPGLADMHSHFGNGILAPGEDDTEQVLARHLYFGNTTILNLGSSQAWPKRIDELRKRMSAGRLEGPRLLAVGSLITVPGSHPVATIYGKEVQEKIAGIVKDHKGTGPIDLAPLRATTLVRSADDLRQEVKRVAEWGADAIKLTVESGPGPFGNDHPRITPEMIRAAAETAKPYGIPVLCHVTSMDELEDCLANGANGIVHGVVDDRHEFPDDLEARMKGAGFVEIPTAAMFDGWHRYTKDPSLLDSALLKPVLSDAELGWLKSPGMLKSMSMDDDWAEKYIGRLGTHLKIYADAGGMVVAGTDTGNPYRIAGYSLHEEIAFYVKYGLTPMEALRTATVNAAALVGDENEWGSIKPGLAADMLILDKNPLDDISNTLAIADVIKGGKVVDRDALPLK